VTSGAREDAAARERAVTTVDRNLVVVAGAGSGKTSLLVERVLHLVLARDVPVGEIAAITFTEAAAAELRDRIARELGAALALSEGAAAREKAGEADRSLARLRAASIDTADIGARARRALREIDRAVLTTIHGLCRRILARHPIESGLPPRFTPVDSARIERAAKDVWPEALAQLAQGERAAELESLLERLEVKDLEVFALGLADAAARRGAPVPDATAPLRAAIARALERLRASATAVAARTKRPIVFTRRAADLAERLEAALREAPAALRARYPDPPEEPGKAQAVLAEDLDAFRRARDVVARYAEIDDATIERATALLAPAAARLRSAVESAGLVSFDGLLVLARDLLRDRPDVRRAESGRLRTLLVDEFQDTDPLQYEIVFFLAEDPAASPARDAWTARLARGRLFAVGDPKQSIYRFRGADLSAHARACERILEEGGERVELRLSFRSPPAILEPLQTAFAGWLPARDDDERETRAAPEWVAVSSARAGADPRFGAEPRVEMWTLPAADAAGERRRNEADWIAADVVRSVGERGARPRDHAILLRAFSDVAIYARALERRNVPYVLEGGRTFYARSEVNDLSSVLRAVAEPNDAIALLAVLRSPAGGATDAELERHVRAKGIWSAWSSPDPAVAPNVARTFAWIRELRVRAASISTGELVREAIATSRLVELHAAGFDGAQRIANLRKLQGIAEESARDPAASIEDVALELERRAGDERGDGELSLAEEGTDAVAVLTFHKAKGLEFPVVYVADLERRSHHSDPARAELSIDERPPGPGVVACSRRRVRTSLSALREVERPAHRSAERRREIYVATTRARERLVLLACENGSSESVAALGAAWGYRGDDPPPDGALLAGGAVVHRRIAGAPPDSALAPRAAESFVAAARRFRSAADAASRAARPPLASPTSLRERDENDAFASVARKMGPGPVSAAAIGATVHAALERADFARPESFASPEIVAPLAAMEAAARGDDADMVARDAGALLARFAASPLRARLAAARIVARELPISAPADSADAGAEVVHGYADVVFEEKGAWTVADFKTDAVVSDDHRRQVAWYAAALARSARRPVRAEVWFLREGRAIVLT